MLKVVYMIPSSCSVRLVPTLYKSKIPGHSHVSIPKGDVISIKFASVANGTTPFCCQTHSQQNLPKS